MKVLVCGSRDFDQWARLFGVLDECLKKLPLMEVVEGEAKGADTYARQWAEERGVVVHKFPADWAKHGKAAGPIRNKQMLDSGVELVIAFPLSTMGRGTGDMVRQAQAAKIPVQIVSYL